MTSQRQREFHLRLYEILKDEICVDCGENDILVLQFDHIYGPKRQSISSLMQTAQDWSEVEAEIRLCEVRCANCHTRKTAKEQEWYRMVLGEIEAEV